MPPLAGGGVTILLPLVLAIGAARPAATALGAVVLDCAWLHTSVELVPCTRDDDVVDRTEKEFDEDEDEEADEDEDKEGVADGADDQVASR